MSETETRSGAPTAMIGALFGFKGRIGRGHYLAGLLLALVVLLAAVMVAASAMNPTGGGAPLLAVPMLAIFVWMFAALGVQRFRDAGRSPALVLLQLALLVLVVYPGLEFIETLWPLLLAGGVVALILPALAPETRYAASSAAS